MLNINSIKNKTKLMQSLMSLYLPFIPSLFIRKKFYKKSNFKDVNGVTIMEGSIIKASICRHFFGDIPFNDKNESVHCVMYEDGEFGSDIHGDFDLLKEYNEIVVIGHVEKYRFNKQIDQISGNFFLK